MPPSWMVVLNELVEKEESSYENGFQLNLTTHPQERGGMAVQDKSHPIRNMF